MTLVAVQPGWFWPDIGFSRELQVSGAVMDATGEKHAQIGRLYIDGKPSGAKTLSTGSIQFRTGTCTFANGSTALDIGIQDVATGAGPIAQPDGTFDVKTTLTGGAGITTTAWNTATMNSGTKSMTHGDLIAVVWDMTARAGADSVTIGYTFTTPYNDNNNGFPVTNSYLSGAWQTSPGSGAGYSPNVMIVFDDGTLGWIDCTFPVTSLDNGENFGNGSNPDERGMIFQVPFDCTIDAFYARMGMAGATSDFSMKLYSDPTGTPTLLASCDILAETTQATFGISHMSFPTYVSGVVADVSLSKNTDYCVTLRPTGAGSNYLYTNVVNTTGFRATINNGLTLKKATRDNDTGAFTAESPAVTRYIMGVRICKLHDGAGGAGGGGIRMAGHGGLAA